MSLGQYIKSVRSQRGLSQWELSRLSGLTRSHLSRLELDDIEDPSAETFLALARGLKVHPNDLYQAAGYIDERARFRRTLETTPDEAFEELERKSDIVGLAARGFSLEPAVREGDVVIIDRRQPPAEGDMVLSYRDRKVQLERFGVQPPDGRHVYGVVVGVNRRGKNTADSAMGPGRGAGQM